MTTKDITKVRKSSLRSMLMNIIGTDRKLDFFNANESYIDFITNLGLTAQYHTENGCMYVTAISEADGPWNNAD